MAKHRTKPQAPILNGRSPLTQSLVLCVPFSERGGSTIHDLSKNRRVATAGGSPSWSINDTGLAISWLGSSSQYVSFSNPTSLQLTGRISLFAWIKTAGAGTSYRAIVSKENAYGMFLKDGVFIAYDWGSSTERNSGVNLADNKLHMVGFVFDNGVSSACKLYIDGKVVLTTTYTIQSQIKGLSVARQELSGHHFTGFIDNVMLWNRIITPSEIQQLYANPWQIYRRPTLRLGKAPAVVAANNTNAVWFGANF